MKENFLQFLLMALSCSFVHVICDPCDSVQSYEDSKLTVYSTVSTIHTCNSASQKIP